ncbi:MAG TPA: HAD family hydrolase [Vicinamibacteria bacterium]|nr:HAD family hydrolase [Vicinamibacteria bacterium]
MTDRPRELRAVLFDWDGTLVDSAEHTFRCYVAVFDRFGVPFDRAAFERTYSPDWYRTYRTLGLDECHWPEADRLWQTHYATDAAALLPGARECLQRLREAGLALSVVTSGERERVEREQANLGLAGTFEVMVCGGETRERKPHPAPLLMALGRLGLPASGSAYVGDSPEDVEMARAADVYTVGIPGGFPNREALARSRPDVIASSLADAADRLLG